MNEQPELLPQGMIRKLLCWFRLCPCRPKSDDKGCWGECVHCGRVAGYTTRESIRDYIKHEERHTQKMYYLQQR